VFCYGQQSVKSSILNEIQKQNKERTLLINIGIESGLLNPAGVVFLNENLSFVKYHLIYLA